MDLVVENIEGVSFDTLQKEFNQIGECQVENNKTYLRITYPDAYNAIEAINRLHEKCVESKILRVKFMTAKPRKASPPRSRSRSPRRDEPEKTKTDNLESQDIKEVEVVDQSPNTGLQANDVNKPAEKEETVEDKPDEVPHRLGTQAFKFENIVPSKTETDVKTLQNQEAVAATKSAVEALDKKQGEEATSSGPIVTDPVHNSAELDEVPVHNLEDKIPVAPKSTRQQPSRKGRAQTNSHKMDK